jgi:hypothetical protein
MILTKTTCTRALTRLGIVGQEVKAVKLSDLDGFIEVQTANKSFFVPTELVKSSFVELRKEGSKTLQVKALGNLVYSVSNPAKKSCYHVKRTDTSVICQCEDYRKMVETGIKNPCCKHGYAVLNVLGYASLRDYLIAGE